MICDLYGLVVACRAGSPELAADLMRPFRYFERPESAPGLTIVVEQTDPPYATFPSLTASFSTPRNIVYQNGSCKIIDYFGKGAVVEERAPAAYRVFGRDLNFLREAVYLLITALFGQHCDRHGLLRIHALALSYGDTAVLLPMPPGAGKSTLALAMLEEDGFKLLSEDDPVVDRSGAVSRRFALATRLAFASRTYHMAHSSDVRDNARVLTTFIHATAGRRTTARP